jgi:phosphoribosylformylglycinamidine synthase
VANIAGLCNEARNVVGLMPHPSARASWRHGADGLVMLQSAVQLVHARAPAAVAVRGASSLSA